MQIFQHRHIEYYFERRRYGTGASSRTFTWLNWRVRVDGDITKPRHVWNSYGDPWQKIKLNKKELAKALAHIMWLTTEVGGTIKNHMGWEGKILEKIEAKSPYESDRLRVFFPASDTEHVVPSETIVEVK